MSMSYETTHEVFEGRELVELRDPVVNGQGPASVSEAAGSYDEIIDILDEVAGYIETTTGQLQVTREGTAADAAAGSVSPLAGYATAAAPNAASARVAVHDEAGHYSKAKSSMPEPMDKPSFWQLAATVMTAPIPGISQENYFAQRAEYDERKAQAAHVMNTYQGSSNSTVSGMPTFTAPQAATIGLAIPGGEQVDARGPSGGAPSVNGGGGVTGGGGTTGGGGGGAGGGGGGGGGGGTTAGGGGGAGGAAGGGAAQLPRTGGASLLALGAGALLVGGGLVARRIVR